MDVFIVRPFGTKEVAKRNKETGESSIVKIDFDNVENLLIAEALKAVGLTGGTTGKIFEAGDIREDMFSLLLLADIVIADITIHNANAFYELGIRHALRDQKTILIKSPGFDETPFDILGYRYVSYSKEDPAAALPALIQTLTETLLANRQDSPVFKVLPWLEAVDTEKYRIVPDDFRQEVTRYIETKQTDRLALLSEEVRGFLWEVPALRLIGEGQFRLKALEGARQTWERILKRNPRERGANDRLSTIYSRLADSATLPQQKLEYLALSDQAITQLIEVIYTFDANNRAEIYSLRARNAKSRWNAAWADKLTDTERQIAALTSPYLKQAYEDYAQGFTEDLNHFYSGLNALGLLTVLIELAQLQPATWELEFESESKAQQALQEYNDRHKELETTVMVSLEAARKRLDRLGQEDRWLTVSLADVNCLILKRPERVGLLYKRALSNLQTIHIDAAHRQLLMYQQLAILPDNVGAALREFPAIAPEGVVEKTTYLLFTGHMIDKKGRVDKDGNPDPRFPPEKEASARKAIYEAVVTEKAKTSGSLVGLAGGACGGDILFHEVCCELDIPTQLVLALPRDQFLNESVQFAGAGWVERFNKIEQNAGPNLPTEVLAASEELPNWLQKKPNYSIWERNNLWMLNKSLANGGQYLTLIVLWDGKPSDAGGGTEHMVNQAQARGAKTVVIAFNNLI